MRARGDANHLLASAVQSRGSVTTCPRQRRRQPPTPR